MALISTPLDSKTSSRGLASPKGLAKGSPLALVLLRRERSARADRGFSCTVEFERKRNQGQGREDEIRRGYARRHIRDSEQIKMRL